MPLFIGFVTTGVPLGETFSFLVSAPMVNEVALVLLFGLLGKGAALGTVLAFMMAVIGLSLPETIILRKVLRPPLIAVFVGVVGTGILIVGYLFNAIL